MITPKSPLMDQLYGTTMADLVYNQLEALDPELNQEIQQIAYDHFWARTGLSIRDKSLVTVTALITSHKEEQTRIHMHGFLNAGGSREELVNLLIYLTTQSNNLLIFQNGLDVLITVLSENSDLSVSKIAIKKEFDNYLICKRQNKKIILFSSRDEDIINFVFRVTEGKQDRIVESIRIFLKHSNDDIKTLKNILIHLIVYCGFPASMNGFVALKEELDIRAIEADN